VRPVVVTIVALGVAFSAALFAWERRTTVARADVTTVAPLPAFPENVNPVPGGFSGRSYTENGIVYRYQIFYPHDYAATKVWPTIVALHSSGERGSDGVRQLSVGLGAYVREHSATFPAVVVFPQVPVGEKGQRHNPAIRRLVDSALREVNADPRRVYLTGLSAGGVQVYDFIYHYPGRFAAAIPVAATTAMMRPDSSGWMTSAEAYAAEAHALGSTPIWIFHGADDQILPVVETRKAVEVFRAAGVPVKYTEYPDGPHVIWDRVYQTPGLWSWLFAQHR
jgi:predicted peptidase